MSFVEHFDGGSLPSGWGAFVAGNASHSYSDSIATATWTSGVASASALYYATKLDLSKRQRWAMCRRTAQNSPHAYLRLIADTNPPAADTRANLDAKTVLRCLDITSGTRKGQLSYRDTGGTYQHWDDTSKAFGTTSNPSIPTKSIDDYDIVGFEYDPNFGVARFRMFWIHCADGSTLTEAAGPKLFALTDWFNASATEDGGNASLWPVFGWPETDFDLAGSYGIEWVAMDDGPVLEAVTNEKADAGGVYNLKAWTALGVDATLWLPDSRTAQLITLAAQSWHTTQVQMKSCLRDEDGTLYMTYNGRTGANNDIGIASGISLGSLTEYASNPILAAAGTGNLTTLVTHALVKDMTEPDPTKRWKLFVSPFGADTKYRVYLYTASASTGPLTTAWTQQGIFLDADGIDATDGGSVHMRPQWSEGLWWIFYNAGLGPTTRVRYATATSLAVGALTKHGELFDGVSGDEMTPTSVSGRTISGTVPPSFVKDMLVCYDADATDDAWGVSRIRKVNGGSIELYHYIPGASTSGRIRGFDAGAISVHDVRRFNGEWWLNISMYQVFNTHASFRAFAEITGVMRSASLKGPWVIDWFRSPQPRWGRDNNQRSSENIALVGTPSYPPTRLAPRLGWVGRRRGGR